MKNYGYAKQKKRLVQYENMLKDNFYMYYAAEQTLATAEQLFQKTYALTFTPAIVSYVTWVLKNAKARNIKRLYFLARDAYPMYIIAKELCEEESLNLDIEVKYLRVSRYSLRIPEYHLLKENCLDRIFLSGIDVSFRRILARAGLTETEMERVKEQLQIELSLDDVLNRMQIIRLKEKTLEACVSGRCDLLKIIDLHSKECFDSTLGYLLQEGLLDDINYAIVDSGWVGSIQKSLQNILATQKSDIRILGFYFGLYELPNDISGCDYEAFYFGPKGELLRKTRFSNCLFEMVYSENCGMVKSYQKKDGGFHAVLSDIENPNKKMLEGNEAVLKNFLKGMRRHPEALKRYFDEFGENEIKIVGRILSTLMSNPTSWEADVFGGGLFSDDLDDSHMRKTANELTQKEIRDLGIISKSLIALGLSKKVIHESAWIEASIVNAKKNVAMNLFFAKLAKTLTYVRQNMKNSRK